MIVDIEKYRRITLNQRLCAPTQPRLIFWGEILENRTLSRKFESIIENLQI